MSLWECERDGGECHGMRALRILRTNANVLDLDGAGAVPDRPLYVRAWTCVWDGMGWTHVLCYANDSDSPLMSNV